MTPTYPSTALAVLLLLIAAPHQTVGADDAPPPRVIEELIVTARKKAESIQDVPISITALDGDFLKAAGIENIHELTRYVPNVRYTINPCCTVFIRGFGTQFAASAFDPTVGLALDELSIAKEVYMADPLYDIEQFEVLRGPQGTLFGKNTPAGLLNVRTGAPTRELSGYLIGRIGGLGVHRVEAAIGGPLGPLGDVAQFRLAVLESEEAGDVENTKLGIREPANRQQAGRLKLALQPLDGLDVLLIGSRAMTDSREVPSQLHEVRASTAEFLRGYDPRFEDDGFDHRNSIDLRDSLVRDTELLQANVHYAPGDLGFVRSPELVAVVGDTSFDYDPPLDVDSSPAVVLNIPSPAAFDYGQRSAELRFSGFVPAPFGFGEIELLAGALLFEGTLESDFDVVAGEDFDDYATSAAGFELATGSEPPGGVGFEDVSAFAAAVGAPPVPSPASLEGDGLRLRLDQATESRAFFGRLAWHLFDDRWTVDFGWRLTVEDKAADLLNDCFDPGVICGALGAEEYDLHLERSETDFSPKVTVQYRPFEALTLFAARAQGFKSGGYNNFSLTSEAIEVEPEKTVSWEVGAKGTLLEDTLSYGVAFFDMDVEDLQLQTLMGAIVQVRNAASARSRGVEADLRWLTPWEPLSFRGAGAFTDARFKDFPNAPAPASAAETEQDLSGNRMPFVAKTQISGTPELRFPFAVPALRRLGSILATDLAFTAALDVLYRSRVFLDADLDPRSLQKAYAMLDGRIGFTTTDDAVALGVSVSNLTDEDVADLKIDSLVYPGGFMVLQEFQRNFVFELRVQW